MNYQESKEYYESKGLKYVFGSEKLPANVNELDSLHVFLSSIFSKHTHVSISRT